MEKRSSIFSCKCTRPHPEHLPDSLEPPGIRASDVTGRVDLLKKKKWNEQ